MVSAGKRERAQEVRRLWCEGDSGYCRDSERLEVFALRLFL